MDSFEAARVVHDKIKELEPHVARKIIGYMYLHEIPEQEMIRLAFGPENLIQNLIQEVKTALFLPSTQMMSPPLSPNMNPNPNPNPFPDPPVQFAPFSFDSPRPMPSPPSLHRVPPYCYPQLATEHQPIHNTAMNLIPYSDIPNDFYGPDAAFNNLIIRGGRNPMNIIDYPVKSCHYFNKGFCKHGSNCRFFHSDFFPESYAQTFDPNAYDAATREDQLVYPGSLEKLEMEVAELLRSRRGQPVSIASLPMLYHEKYGRNLQAEGYLTESQRHGKAGYSLTKLLARLKNSIRLIDRPHGQHAIILAEDASKYMDIRGERNDPGPIVSGSRQIYLTFPAESTFTEEDVSNYFSNFGPVQDVRIPCQQKRMFGFVTFASSDTVKLILSKGNPHYVCGARVLVKPYREKSKLAERKFQEKFDRPMFYFSNPIDIDLELQARSESHRLFRRQLIEEHEKTLELETRHLSQLRLPPKSMAGHSLFGYSMDQLKGPQDHPRFPSAERFNYLLDVLNSGSNNDDNTKYPTNNCGDQESAQGLNLPDSPFASAVASSISAVM